MLIHVLLLFVDFVRYGKPFGLPWCQFALCVQKLVDVFSDPADILELLLDCFAGLFAGALFALCLIQLIFSVVSDLLPPSGVGTSGVLYAMIISLISPRMSSVSRLRNSTRSDGTKIGSVWYPGNPMKY